MPAWASGPRQNLEYWRAADMYERANGRLFKSIEFALPRELNHAQRLALSSAFCARVACTANGESLPFLMAIHAGKGTNPHTHLMVSERVLDGYDRTPESWFSRAAVKGKSPDSGGAKKTVGLKPREWLMTTRALLATLTNEALQAAGFAARIDARSLADQGIDRVPGVHLGPAGAARLKRGATSRRADDFVQQRAAALQERQLIDALRNESRAVEQELVTALRHDQSSISSTTSGMLARARRQAEQVRQMAITPKPERSKSSDFDFRP